MYCYLCNKLTCSAVLVFLPAWVGGGLSIVVSGQHGRQSPTLAGIRSSVTVGLCPYLQITRKPLIGTPCC